MDIKRLFEGIKKEKSPEEKRREEIAEWGETLQALGEAGYLSEEMKHRGYQQVAQGILDKLPLSIKVFELSADVYATRLDENTKREIDDSEIVDLEEVQTFIKKGNFDHGKRD